MKMGRHDSESDEALVRRLQNGDMTAFDVVFDRYHRPLMSYLYAMVRDRAQAEDVVQDTFLRLVKSLRRIDARRGLGPWLYRVARNRAVDLLRRRKRTAERDDAFRQTAEPLEDTAGERPDVQMADAELHAQVRAALARLPDIDRDILTLRFYGELTFREIAAVLKRPLGTVLWRSRRSLERFSEEWKEEQEHQP